MLISIFLASTLFQPSVSGQPTLAAKVADAIDHNYLYAEGDSWKRLRPTLLANADATVLSLDRELAALHDADLRIINSDQIATLQAETAGKEWHRTGRFLRHCRTKDR